MADINPFDLLREEMESDETHLRVNAIHRLKIVGTLLGAEQIKTVLLPYIDHLIKKEEDEVLFAIAQEIECLAKLLPGNQTALLPFIEQLTSSEETVVRDMVKCGYQIPLQNKHFVLFLDIQAVKTLINLSAGFSDNDIINFYIPLIFRLANNDSNFTCRVSAVNLMATIYPRAGQHKEKIRTEETPMVRRAVAVKIGELAQVVEREIVASDFIASIKQLMSDEQDLVRVLVLSSLKLVARVLEIHENREYTLPILIAATEDKSWRVRLNLSKIFPEIVEAFGSESNNMSIIQIFTNLLRDAENDVRTASIQSLGKYIKSLDQEKLNIFIPHLQQLAKDSVSQVRVGVADVFTIIAPILSKDTCLSKLQPLIIELFDDEVKEVRLGITRAAGKFVEVTGLESLKLLIPQFKKSIDDPKWRVRIEAYNAIAQLSKTFNSTLEPMFMSYLKDRTSVIRENCIEKLPLLIQSYKDWGLGKLYNKLIEASNKDNGYLYRVTALQSLKALAQCIAPDTAADKIVPILIKHLNDTVPNVRFMVIKLLKELSSKYQNSNTYNEIKNNINNLQNDGDKDVKYFSQEAVQYLQTH